MNGVSTDPGRERFWLGRARAVAFRVNSGWWLDRFNGLLVIGLVTFAVVILILRTDQSPWLESWIPLGVLGLVLVALGMTAWIVARKKFINREDGLVRLDDKLHLRNRLVSASSGVGQWPESSKDSDGDASPEWRWPVVLLPSGLAALAVAVAWWIPLPDPQTEDPLVVNEPEPWGQMEEWIETLKEEELIEEDSLRELEEKIEDLREQPEEEWFSHSSMEATDTLKDSLGRDIQELAGDMDTLDRDLEALRTFSTEMTEEGKEMLLREMDEAMKSMASNGLEMNEALAEQLSGLDPSKMSQEMMKNLSSEEMQQLQKQLQSGCQALGSMEGLPSMEGEGLAEMMLMREGQFGRGGISRGRGDAPLFYGDEENLKTNNIESVKNDDLSQAAIGDLLGVGETEHTDEELATAVRKGGAASSAGKGGEAVWRESLLPGEKALLKRYFK